MGRGACDPFFSFHGAGDEGDSPEVSESTERSSTPRKSVLEVTEKWFDSLNEIEQLCWAFDILPSQAAQFQWQVIWYDVIYKIKIKLNELTTNHLQYYMSLIEVVGALFGGQKDDKTPNKEGALRVNDMPPEEAVEKLNALFAMAGPN